MFIPSICFQYYILNVHFTMGAYWNGDLIKKKCTLKGGLIRKGEPIGRQALNRIITVVRLCKLWENITGADTQKEWKKTLYDETTIQKLTK